MPSDIAWNLVFCKKELPNIRNQAYIRSSKNKNFLVERQNLPSARGGFVPERKVNRLKKATYFNMSLSREKINNHTLFLYDKDPKVH